MQWYSGGLLLEDSPVKGPFDSAGLRFGASVFSTMRVCQQKLEDPRSQFSAHCDRLAHSIRAFNWQPPNWTSVYRGCAQLKTHYPVLRITLFADGTEWITGRAVPAQLNAQQQTGVACWRAPPTYTRSLPLHKTGNYLACQLARQQAQTYGAQEAILTNERGDWLETATGNLWGYAKGQWWTPIGDQLSNQCLPGLMRTRLQQSLSKDGEQVNNQPWNKSVLRGFDAIAYSNCVVELVPIHTILDGQIKLEYDPQHASLMALRGRLTSSAQPGDDS
ncbi:MAG: aminotransferase class IV [Phormidesmis sp.]